MRAILLKRMARLEKNIRDKSRIPVLIVELNNDGTYIYAGETYTEAQLNKFADEKRAETIIIDDLFQE